MGSAAHMSVPLVRWNKAAASPNTSVTLRDKTGLAGNVQPERRPEQR